MIGGFFRMLSFWKIIMILLLWFFVLKPMLSGSYNQIRAFYWWMRP